MDPTTAALEKEHEAVSIRWIASLAHTLQSYKIWSSYYPMIVTGWS